MATSTQEIIRIIHKKNAAAFMRSSLFKEYYTQTVGECVVMPNAHQPSLEQLRRFIDALVRRTGDHRLVLILRDGRIAAHCTLITSPWNVWQVESVCVATAARGQGLCKRLMEAAIAHVRGRRGRRVQVFCCPKNGAACACYRSCFGPPVHVTRQTVAFEIDLTSTT